MDKEKIEELISDSRLTFVHGKYQEALKLAEQAIKLEPKNADAYQCAGNACMAFADYEKAIGYYKKAVENDSGNGDRYFNLGYAYATSNQSSMALAMFAKADETGCSPNIVGQLYKIMAMFCFDLHKYDDAILNFTKAEQIVGIDMDILKRKALSYSMNGDISNAIETANEIKLVFPTDYIGYRIAFNILLQENRFNEAEKELDRAERFAKPTAELFFDWLTYETTLYGLEKNSEHLNRAIEKIHEGLCVVPPEVNEVIDSYINTAEIYVQLENADMALNCLRAAENPIQAYNERFSVIEIPERETKSVSRPSEREINHAVEAVRRKYGDRRLEAMGREMTKKKGKGTSVSDNMTPVSNNEEADIPRLDGGIKAKYSVEKLEQIYRLYVAAYTLKNDSAHIKTYAARLANSGDIHNKCIGKYNLVRAMKNEGQSCADEEYGRLLKFLRHEMIKAPTDFMILSMRIQCYIDIGEYDEAEQLCGLLSDELKQPLMEQISNARSGGDA